MKDMPVVVKNKKAYFNYHILEKMEAGMVLSGQEVKSIKAGRASLSSAYVVIKKGEAYLVNCNIPPYQPKNAPSNYNPTADRKLLLNKKEINYLIGKTGEKGITLVPLSIYTKNNLLKLEIGLGKGKRKKDKREDLKKKDIDKRLKQIIKASRG